jgi:acyl-CoA synthetase (AMP-forming)/AMP-acid ligase II
MIFRSPLPDLVIPEGTDFSSFALQRARQQPSKTALIDAATGARLTYGELVSAVDAAAGGLTARGFASGDVVAICGFNTLDYAIAAHAVWRAGGVVATMNPLFTVREMENELADARPRWLVAAPEVIQRAKEAAQSVGGVTELFALGEGPDVLPFRALEQGGHAPPTVHVERTAEEVALLLYSSGTTGLPKGVMLTHRGLIAALLQLHSGDLARQDDVLVAISPFFHVVGLHGILNLGIFAGSTIVTMTRYQTAQFLEAVQQHRISSAFLTPPILVDLTKSPSTDQYDISSLRSILCAAAPLGPELEQAAADKLRCAVRQGYGMTEATGPVTTSLLEPWEIRRGSAGQLVPSTEARIVDLESGRELEPGQTGEVTVRGPQVAKGYLHNAEATARTIEAGGWLHTGDVGYADPDGYFFIVDRVKEIIKYKAYQVAPAELEDVLGSHPRVADVAVIPSPAPEVGEVPKAFVVRAGDVTAEELLAYVAERVAPYKKVREVEFVESIPKSASGKILRRVLIEQERAAAAMKHPS